MRQDGAYGGCGGLVGIKYMVQYPVLDAGCKNLQIAGPSLNIDSADAVLAKLLHGR